MGTAHPGVSLGVGEGGSAYSPPQREGMGVGGGQGECARSPALYDDFCGDWIDRDGRSMGTRTPPVLAPPPSSGALYEREQRGRERERGRERDYVRESMGWGVMGGIVGGVLRPRPRVRVEVKGLVLLPHGLVR